MFPGNMNYQLHLFCSELDQIWPQLVMYGLRIRLASLLLCQLVAYQTCHFHRVNSLIRPLWCLQIDTKRQQNDALVKSWLTHCRKQQFALEAIVAIFVITTCAYCIHREDVCLVFTILYCNKGTRGLKVARLKR